LEVGEEELLDGGLAEQAAFDGSLFQKDGAHPALEVATEPKSIRHGETGLFAMKDFARDMGGKGALGNVFGDEAADFELRRKRSRKFEDLVVEKGNAELDGIGHGHFVGFDEQVIGQPGFCVHVEHPAKRIEAAAGGTIVKARDRIQGSGFVDGSE